VVFSGTTGFSNNETDHYDITEILLEVVFNTITSFFLLTSVSLLEKPVVPEKTTDLSLTKRRK
jgi:hypothetical protein